MYENITWSSDDHVNFINIRQVAYLFFCYAKCCSAIQLSIMSVY